MFCDRGVNDKAGAGCSNCTDTDTSSMLHLFFASASSRQEAALGRQPGCSTSSPLRLRFRFASPIIRHRPLIGRTRLVLRLAETLRLASTSSSFFRLHLAGLMNPKFGCRVKGKARTGCYNCTTQTLCIRFVSPVLLCLVETMPSAGRCCAAPLRLLSSRFFPGASAIRIRSVRARRHKQ